MKHLKTQIAILSVSLVLFGCGGSAVLTQGGEYDDVYYTAADREPAYVETEVYNATSSFSDEYTETLTEEDLSEFEDINYSSKSINPEYIEKYSSEDFEASATEDVEYFDENYQSQGQTDEDIYFTKEEIDEAQQKYYPSTYSSTGANPVNVNIGFGVGVGSGFGYSPWNNPWYSSSFYGSRYSTFYNDPWGFGRPYNPWYGGSGVYYGSSWNTGFYNSPGYCPPVGYGGVGVAVASPVSVVRPSENVYRVSNIGARSATGRSAVDATNNTRSQYRGSTAGRDFGDDTLVPLSTNRVATTGSNSSQTGYYRRSRNSRNDAYSGSTTTRSYQQYRRNSQPTRTSVSNSSSNTSRNTTFRSSSNSNTRSSGSSYRSYSNSRNSGFRSSSGSSGNSFRSSSGSRSNSSFRGSSGSSSGRTVRSSSSSSTRSRRGN